MAEIFVLVEHRRDEIRDITFEMLTKGREIAKKLNVPLAAILLAHPCDNFANRLKNMLIKYYALMMKR